MGRPRFLTALLLATLVGGFSVSALSTTRSLSELDGTLVKLHHETFSDDGIAAAAGDDHGYVVDTGTALVPVRLPGTAPLGAHVHLRGNYESTDDGKVFVASAAEPVDAAGSSAVPPGPTVKVAVILFNFTNNRTQPVTPVAVHSVMFDDPDSVSAYYRAASNGQITITGDVFGWYPINLSNTVCDLAAWRTAALAATTAAGVNLSSYQYTVFANTAASSCQFTGSAAMPGTNTWINGSFSSSTFGHELGHNFGMDHASTWSCTSGGAAVTVSDSCSTIEYGDTFDVMGSGGVRMLNAWHLAQLGWLTGKQTVSTTGTYTVTPLDDNVASPRLLRIPRPDGTFFQLEFRRPSGTFGNFQPDWPVVNGVTIRVAPDDQGPISRSYLVDATPETPTFWDSALPVGRTFGDDVGSLATHVQVTTLAVSPTGATVHVQFGGAPPTTTTTTTTTPTTTTTTTTPTTTTTVPPAAQVGFVKQLATATRTQSGNTSITLVVPVGGAAVGHRVIVAAGVGTFGGTWACTDSRGNTYTIDGVAPAHNLFVCSGHLATALQPGDTITVSYPAYSGTTAATAAEFTGIKPVTALDGVARAGSSTSTKTVSVNPVLKTTAPGDLLFSAVGVNTAFTPASGFTAASSFGNVNTAFQATTGTGTYNALGTVTSGAWRALLVPYRAA